MADTMIDLMSAEARASRKVMLCFAAVVVLLIVALGMGA
jgi:hypothetical protein